MLALALDRNPKNPTLGDAYVPKVPNVGSVSVPNELNKNSKVELHSSKTFFWWPSFFAIFPYKICDF